MPDATDGLPGQAASLGHGARAPMRRVLGLALQRVRDDPLDLLIVNPTRGTAARQFTESGGLVLQKTLTPFPHRWRAEMRAVNNFGVRQSLGGPKDYLRAEHFHVPGTAATNGLLQGLFFSRGEFQF